MLIQFDPRTPSSRISTTLRWILQVHCNITPRPRLRRCQGCWAILKISMEKWLLFPFSSFSPFFPIPIYIPHAMLFTLSCILFSASALALYPNPYGNPTGSINLCTDSSCLTNAYANDWAMGGDFCSVLPPESSYKPPSTLGSYLVHLRPTCDNGSFADWATYGDTSCSKEKTRLPYNKNDKCESFAGVLAVAFICQGFGGLNSVATSTIISQATTSSSSSVQGLLESHATTAATPSTSSATTRLTTSVILSSLLSTTKVEQSGVKTSASLSSLPAIRTGAASRAKSEFAFFAPLIQVWLFIGL
jgi:hypothetical protein